jgi:hypothetical protein
VEPSISFDISNFVGVKSVRRAQAVHPFEKGRQVQPQNWSPLNQTSMNTGQEKDKLQCHHVCLVCEQCDCVHPQNKE